MQLFARFDSATGEGITNSYDGFGRLKTHINNMGGTSRLLFYTWDAAGNRIDIAHPDGLWFSTNYDGLNRPTYLSGNGNTGIAFAHYFADGGLYAVNRHHPATWAVVAQTFLTYDGIQRPATLSHSPGGGAVAWTYARNPAGQLSSIARDNDAYAWTGHYAVNRAYTTNGLNQYSAAGGASFAYDANGNLTSDGSRNFVYDVENRLVSASPNVTLSYDPLGRLFQLSVGGSVTTTFLYDGDALVAEYDGAGVMTRRYVHWPGADLPMASYADATLSNPTHLLADHQGSIVAHANGVGALTAINRYDEYGIPAASNVGRFQYTGQIWLPELGMYHYKSRVYSPYLGRFMQTDSVGYQGGINLYAYVNNDPVNLVDPTGMAGECDTGSRIPGGYSGCRVLEGYAIRQGAQQGGRGSINVSGPQGRRILAAMRRDPEVVAAMEEAWRRSRGDGPTREKNEHGFWLAPVRSDFSIGRMLRGTGTNIDGREIDRAHDELPGARIFFHTHPFRIREAAGVRSLGISREDRRIASRHRALVISVARPEPYARHGWFFDIDDGFYVPPGR